MYIYAELALTQQDTVQMVQFCVCQALVGQKTLT